MMHGTVPKSMKEENVVFIVAFARNDFTQCHRNGKRIIKHTIRIDVTTELGIRQPLSHLGCKTRTHQQQIILLRKKGHTGNYFYRRIKIHKLGIKNIHIREKDVPTYLLRHKDSKFQYITVET